MFAELNNKNQRISLSKVEELIERTVKSWIEDVIEDYKKVLNGEIEISEVKTSEQRIVYELLGRAGIGKTDRINNLAKRVSSYCQRKHGVEVELKSVFSTLGHNSNFAGMEIPEGNRSKRVYPSYAPNPKKLTILYLDETRDYSENALKEVQKITDGSNPTFGDRYIPFCFPILSGNSVDGNIFSESFNLPLENRVNSMFIKPSLEDWVSWALKNKVDLRAISFGIAIGIDNLDSLSDDEQTDNETQFISLRSLTTLGRKLEMLDKIDDEDIFTSVLVGTLGKTYASKFLSFINQVEIPPNSTSDELIERFSNYKFKESTLNEVSLTIKQFNRLVEADFKYFVDTGVKLNLLGFGPSGIGKTQSTKKLFDNLNRNSKVINLSNLSRTSPQGFMFPDGDELRTIKPSYFPKVNDVLIFDEFTDNLNEKSKISLVQQLTNPNPEWAEYKLGQNYMVFLGNGTNETVYGGTIPAPLKNRMCILRIKQTLEEVIDYFRKNNVDPRIIGFLKLNFETEQPIELEVGDSFMTPRSLMRLNQMIKLTDGNDELLEVVAKSSLGEESGEKFIAYLSSVYGTLDVEDILNSKKLLKTRKFKDSIEGQLFIEKFMVWLKRRTSIWQKNDWITDCYQLAEQRNPFGRMEKVKTLNMDCLKSLFKDELTILEFIGNQDIETAISAFSLVSSKNLSSNPEEVSKWFTGFSKLIESEDGVKFENIDKSKRQMVFDVLRQSMRSGKRRV
jgi:hypothetical protein